MQPEVEMANKTRIAVLGGGYGGVHAAKILYKQYRRREDIEICLIDKNPYHTLLTELHEIAGSRTEPESVQISFKKIFGGTRVRVVVDDIKSIDFESNTLKSDHSEYQYDYLVIGAGGAPEFFGIPGVQENSLTCWSLEDALRIRTHVENRFRQAAKEPNLDKRRRLLTFAIAGAGFTGIELAGELLERRDTLCAKYHINPREVRVVVIEAMDTILPSLPEKPRQKAMDYLKKRGAEIMLNAPITGAEEGKILIKGDRDIHADTFIWTAGIHGSEFSSRIELTKGQCARGEETVASAEGIHGMSGCRFDEDERYTVGERGRFLVNDYMQSVDVPNVYLIGDIMWHVKDEKVSPQIVEAALQSGETAAKNIIAEMENKSKHPFQPVYHGNMVSIGGKYGVAHVMGMSLSGFAAMAMKHLVNLHYLFGIAGINAVWEYLQEEFFTIKHNRSIMGGHLSAKIPTYWAVPLRIFLGAKWLLEGTKKIFKEDWLYPGEGGWFNVDPSQIRLPGVQFWDSATAATGAATGDAATAATTAATGAAEGASQWGEALIEALPIYTWFAETVLSFSPTITFWLQTAVVLTQVGIGLALIFGAFTFLSGVASIGLGLMFIASGWGNVELLWYLAASFVMLGGAGKAFGLDHWIMPALKRWWNGTRFARKTYLYIGEPREW
jgi:NADH:ubiquinone reductase (H+-translocating)